MAYLNFNRAPSLYLYFLDESETTCMAMLSYTRESSYTPVITVFLYFEVENFLLKRKYAIR